LTLPGFLGLVTVPFCHWGGGIRPATCVLPFLRDFYEGLNVYLALVLGVGWIVLAPVLLIAFRQSLVIKRDKFKAGYRWRTIGQIFRLMNLLFSPLTIVIFVLIIFRP
jgi:hypothetical protein